MYTQASGIEISFPAELDMFPGSADTQTHLQSNADVSFVT